MTQVCSSKHHHHRNGHHQGRLDHHYHNHHLYLKPIIGPAAKLHHASLFVEREILNVHFTRAVVYSWRLPLHGNDYKSKSNIWWYVTIKYFFKSPQQDQCGRELPWWQGKPQNCHQRWEKYLFKFHFSFVSFCPVRFVTDFFSASDFCFYDPTREKYMASRLVLTASVSAPRLKCMTSLSVFTLTPFILKRLSFHSYGVFLLTLVFFHFYHYDRRIQKTY